MLDATITELISGRVCIILCTVVKMANINHILDISLKIKFLKIIQLIHINIPKDAYRHSMKKELEDFVHQIF